MPSHVHVSFPLHQLPPCSPPCPRWLLPFLSFCEVHACFSVAALLVCAFLDCSFFFFSSFLCQVDFLIYQILFPSLPSHLLSVSHYFFHLLSIFYFYFQSIRPSTLSGEKRYYISPCVYQLMAIYLPLFTSLLHALINRRRQSSNCVTSDVGRACQRHRK